MEFYAMKGRELPRFMYRNLVDAITSADASSRAKAIDDFCAHITTLEPSGETQKMKWCMPRALKNALNSEEHTKVEAVLTAKRARRNDRFLEVYPHCSDEFTTERSFLDAAFGSRTSPLLDKRTKIFTFGSCFAQNIAHYLKTKGYNITPFAQTEDLNSPFSNAIMLAACLAPAAEREAYVKKWLSVLYPEEDVKELAPQAIAKLETLKNLLAGSEFIIMTCGNVVDYFLHDKAPAFTSAPAVAPKFLSVSIKEDVTVRSGLTQKLKEAGSEFRLGSYEEVRGAMEALYRSIRTINPTAHLLITLSPIPIESVMGLGAARKQGAIEVDCVSKSLLRVVLHELMVKHADDKNLIYFPSFEVLRWVAPNFGYSIFGHEDAQARHVSQDILVGIYEYFLYKFSKDTAQVEEDTAPTPVAPLPKKKKKKWWRI